MQLSPDQCIATGTLLKACLAGDGLPRRVAVRVEAGGAVVTLDDGTEISGAAAPGEDPERNADQRGRREHLLAGCPVGGAMQIHLCVCAVEGNDRRERATFQQGEQVDADAEVTVDLGPLGTLVIDSPLPAGLGVHVVVREIPRDKVLYDTVYHHPHYGPASVMTHERLPEIQNRRGLWYAGAWTQYGFHEDGLKAGLRAAHELIVDHDLLPRRSASGAISAATARRTGTIGTTHRDRQRCSMLGVMRRAC